MNNPRHSRPQAGPGATGATARLRLLGGVVAAVLCAGAVGTAATTSASPPARTALGYDCPGGLFCGWDGREGTGNMIVQVNGNCVLHDIGNGGVGDQLTSYWNRTGKSVRLSDWMGDHWRTLAVVPDGARGTLAPSADKKTDAVQVCA